MQKSNFMNGFYGLQNLGPKPEGGTEGEAPPGLTPPQLRQVFTLKGHDNIIVFFIAATPNKSADVILS